MSQLLLDKYHPVIGGKRQRGKRLSVVSVKINVADFLVLMDLVNGIGSMQGGAGAILSAVDSLLMASWIPLKSP